MRVLHQHESPWPQGYSSDELRSWMPGEAREVTEAQAAYLTSTFPGAFVAEAPAAPAPVVEPEPAAPAPEPRKSARRRA
jgi:hypothetical protein